MSDAFKRSPVSEYERGGFHLHPGPLFRLFVVIGLVSLLGLSFGGMWDIVRIAGLSLPVLSILYLSLVVAGVRYVQEFSTDHPVKGGSVEYTLTVGNEFLVPFTGLKAELYLGQSARHTERIQPVLLPNSTLVFRRTIVCPFRGVYPVGLSRLEVRDLTGCVTVSLSVFHRVFYVTPRVLSVTPALFLLSRDRPGSERVQYGAGEDVTLFRELSEYRQGQDAGRIVWRYMASRDTPLVPTYDRGVDTGLRIILDTRRISRRSDSFHVEDCSFEIVIAMVHASLSVGVPVSVGGFGLEPQLFTPEHSERLSLFVNATIAMFFESKASPIHYTAPPDRFSEAPVVYVTHHQDDALLELIMDAAPGTCGLVLNVSGHGLTRRRALKRFADSMRLERKLCYAVAAADDLLELS
ncbi:MAG: DUF58 domain-containing protein [Spirochaetota bacterium]